MWWACRSEVMAKPPPSAARSSTCICKQDHWGCLMRQSRQSHAKPLRKCCLHIEVAQADRASRAPGDMHTALAQCSVEFIRPVLQCLMAHLSTGDGPRKGCLGKAQLLKLPKGPMRACRKVSASLTWAPLTSSSRCCSSSCHDIKTVNSTPPVDMGMCTKTRKIPASDATDAPG